MAAAPTSKDLENLKDMFNHAGYKVLMHMSELDLQALKQALEEPARSESDLRVIQGRIIQLNILKNLHKAVELQEQLDAEEREDA